jgi:hypothetical protein
MIDLTETQGATPVKPYARLFHKVTPTVSAAALGYYVATYYRTDKVLVQGVPEFGGAVISPSRFAIVRPALPEYMPDFYTASAFEAIELPAPFNQGAFLTDVNVWMRNRYDEQCMTVRYRQAVVSTEFILWEYNGGTDFVGPYENEQKGSVTIDCKFDRLEASKQLTMTGNLVLSEFFPAYRLDLFRKPTIEITVCSPSVMSRLAWGYLDLARQKQLLQTSRPLGSWTTTI